MPTLIFIDSFDHQAFVDLAEKWTSAAGAISIVSGRTNNGCTIQSGSAQMALMKTFTDSVGTKSQLNSGVAYKSSVFNGNIIRFINLASPAMYADLVHIGDGRVQFSAEARGESRQYSSISTYALSANQWAYLEMGVENSGSIMTYEVRADNETIISGSFTWSGALGAFASAGVSGPGGGDTAIADDYYLGYGGFFGDTEIGVIRPNGAGDTTQWTSFTGGANWDETNDSVPDDDTTYVYTGTAGNIDIYDMEDIGAGINQVYGAQGLIYVKKSAAGTTTIQQQWKTNGSVYDGDTYYPSATDYLYSVQMLTNNPITGTTWTVDEINALQYGPKRAT